MKPILLTRYVEQIGLSEGLAGLLVALPFAGIACASLLMRGWLLRAPYRQIAMVCGGLLIALELLSAFTFSYLSVVMPAQFLSGICVGLLMGTTSRYVSVTRERDQLFGFVDMTAVLLMSFMVYLVGASVASAGIWGGYLAAAIISTLFFAALFVFRPADQKATSDSEQSTAALEFAVRPVAIVAMGVLFVTFSGLGFAFMFTMAADLGMDYESAGRNIGILLFVSAFACQIGGWASAKFGPERPLACAFVTCAAGWYMAVFTDDPIIFMAALVPAIFSLQFCFPILLSFSGSLDTEGRWAGIASPLITSGFAWAAIVAGQVVNYAGIQALAAVTTIGMLLCLGLLAIAVLKKPKVPAV